MANSKIKPHLPVPGCPGCAYLNDIIQCSRWLDMAVQDGVPSPYVPWEQYQELQDQIKELRSELDEAHNTAEALDAKLKALTPHGTCGCSFDTPTDLCMHHSPQLVAMIANRDYYAEQLQTSYKIQQQKITELEQRLANECAVCCGQCETCERVNREATQTESPFHS